MFLITIQALINVLMYDSDNLEKEYNSLQSLGKSALCPRVDLEPATAKKKNVSTFPR